MAVAILLGICAGVVGCVPQVIALRRLKSMTSSEIMSHQLGFLLLVVALSFVILVAALVACSTLAHDVALPFALAEVLTFIVVVIVLGLASRGRR